jgi:hypothetical protein
MVVASLARVAEDGRHRLLFVDFVLFIAAPILMYRRQGFKHDDRTGDSHGPDVPFRAGNDASGSRSEPPTVPIGYSGPYGLHPMSIHGKSVTRLLTDVVADLVVPGCRLGHRQWTEPVKLVADIIRTRLGPGQGPLLGPNLGSMRRATTVLAHFRRATTWRSL